MDITSLHERISAYEHRISDVVIATRQEAQRIEQEREYLTVLHERAVQQEWQHTSKRIVVKNRSLLDIGEKLPWEEILLLSPEGKKAHFHLTCHAYMMMGMNPSYDRMSYETQDKKIVITVQKDRLLIETYGSRKERKLCKTNALRMMEKQLSLYYHVSAVIQHKKGKREYIVTLKNAVLDDNNS